ncbi:aconitate hydratase AcnA [Candidatus Wolfebacteria bacterium]|nr:aconitate hydratase AcnA [Candidatus Wolfebacteria bacterium]
MTCTPLTLPLPAATYNKLPPSLKLLAWHTSKNTLGSFQAWLDGESQEVDVMASQVCLQDFTGIPMLLDMATQRSALHAVGKDPLLIGTKLPIHMVFDHSVTTKFSSLAKNVKEEQRINGDRLRFGKWAGAKMGIRVIPPGVGVIHQLNTEKLVPVFDQTGLPTFLKGTDSHTPMVGANGILAWGVGGPEAMKVVSKEAIGMKIPNVYGVRLSNKLPKGITASDLGLYLKKVLRKTVTKGSFVEFFGEGVDTLALESRGTLSNIAAEFGARTAVFGIDKTTVQFLALSGRDTNVEKLAKAYGLWRNEETEEGVQRTDIIDIDLSEIKSGISGPNTPHNWVSLENAEAHIAKVFEDKGVGSSTKEFTIPEIEEPVPDGALLLASIASCTQTGNPEAVLQAALLARNAVKAGLTTKPWTKTSFAAGSPLADEYLGASNLLPYLEQLGFAIVAHGCGPCIGQSGGLNALGKKLVVAGLTPTSIVSANRNYAGRHDGDIEISFLSNPALIVAYALLGRVDKNIEEADLGNGTLLSDIWPDDDEIAEAKSVINREMYERVYANPTQGNKHWQEIEIPDSDIYDFPKSITIKLPPFFEGLSADLKPIKGLMHARTLCIVGNDYSTDAISPAGDLTKNPAAINYLVQHGVTDTDDILSTGGYRANYEMLMTTIFSNPKARNLMSSRDGGWTIHHPSGEDLTIFETSAQYRHENIDMVVIGGKNYGCGSSRVMAASGPWMLGVRAVIAESFEAIHRSNLWQMGIVPFCFKEGTTAETLGLDGSEEWNIPLNNLSAKSTDLPSSFMKNGEIHKLNLVVALESEQEFEFLQHGGVMQMQLRALF